MTFGRSVIEMMRKLEDFHDTSKVTYKFGKSRLYRAELLLQRFHIVRLYYILQCIKQNTFVFGIEGFINTVDWFNHQSIFAHNSRAVALPLRMHVLSLTA